MRFPLTLIALLAALCPASAGAILQRGDDEPSGKNCVSAEEAGSRLSGDSGEDEDAPPKFTRAFYAHNFTLNVSLDGLDGKQLPVSIEEVCSVPRSLKKQAVQLAGADAIALVSTRTRVWFEGQLKLGDAALTALDGADTSVMRVRLAPTRRWGEDEDGNKLPTFRTRWVKVTD